MNFITTIIDYGSTRSSKEARSSSRRPGRAAKTTRRLQRRKAWAAEGRCQQCGGERPCSCYRKYQ